MKKFNNIHTNKSVEVVNTNVSKDKWIVAISDLKDAICNEEHKMYNVIGKGQDKSNNAIDYYTNAIRMANNNGYFDNTLKSEINKANKEFSALGEESKSDFNIISDNIDMIISYLDENNHIVTLGGVAGMGEVKLPTNGEVGSGEVPGGTAEMGATQTPETEEIKEENKTVIDIDDIVKEILESKPTKESKKVSMKKFEYIKGTREVNENEIYFPIKDIGDPAPLIQLISKELQKRTKLNLSDIVVELTNIEISYNGKVDETTLDKLSDILDTDNKKLKKKIDKLMDKNIELLENMQVEVIKKLLENPETINEGILGRVLGGVAGLTFGPKIGRIIAKVLGVEKGPLYNILTSRIVSAALAQELTKNLL